jgi:uncharacterized membrane protein YtjA (UPF0391 family)
MLRASIIFFVLGIVSMLLGMNGIAGLSIEIGKILLLVFVVLAVISFFMGRRGGKSLALAFMVLAAGASHADDNVVDTMKEVGNDTRRAAKKVVRVTKDKTCRIVNGNTECAIQETKHALQDGSDKVEDALD